MHDIAQRYVFFIKAKEAGVEPVPETQVSLIHQQTIDSKCRSDICTIEDVPHIQTFSSCQ
jgi:hypothetical protein